MRHTALRREESRHPSEQVTLTDERVSGVILEQPVFQAISDFNCTSEPSDLQVKSAEKLPSNPQNKKQEIIVFLINQVME